MICTGSFNLYLMNLLIVLQFRSDAQALKYMNYCTSFFMPIILIKLRHFAGYSYLTLKTITLVPAYAYLPVLIYVNNFCHYLLIDRI